VIAANVDGRALLRLADPRRAEAHHFSGVTSP
jgi:hypothetical protein